MNDTPGSHTGRTAERSSTDGADALGAPRPQPSTVSRRTVLRGAAGATAASVAGVAAAPAAAQDDAPDLGAWFEDVSNYEGVVDATGRDEVTVEVGVEGNGGPYAFGPAAVRVDPGTTVVWEWTGEGSHDVAEVDDAFASELTEDAGYSFDQSFEETGVIQYVCTPHETTGMKGAVLVGDVAPEAPSAGRIGGELPEPDYGDWFDDVGNYEETVDRRGEDEVTVTVGAEGNGGTFAFDPPAVRVDPGTTVVWEWVAGSHDVAADDDSFASELSSEVGHTYEQTFEEEGVTRYVCTPHEGVGMKGAIAVGAGDASDGAAGAAGSGLGETVALGAGLGLVGGLLALFAREAKRQAPGPA